MIRLVCAIAVGAFVIIGIYAVVQANSVQVTYDPTTKILSINQQEFEVLSHTSTSVTVKYLAGGLYARPGEPPGPANPYYPCITTFRSSGFQWEKDAVEIVNLKE